MRSAISTRTVWAVKECMWIIEYSIHRYNLDLHGNNQSSAVFSMNTLRRYCERLLCVKVVKDTRGKKTTSFY